MIRIALCDDNDKDLVRLQQKVETIMREVFPLEKYSLIIFHSPVDLEYDIQTSDVADIFILDVEMPEINGFQIAKKIQDRNAAAVVFFFTAHMEMASKGYIVQALRYINKMAGDGELKNALTTAIRTSKARKSRYIVVEYDRSIRKISLDRILYASLEGGKMSIYLCNVSEPVRETRTLKELKEALGDGRFILINRGTLVNSDYVERIDSGALEMIDGTRLPVSRRLMKEVKEQITSYWRETL